MTVLQYLPDLLFVLVVVATAMVVARKLVVEAAMLFLATLFSSLAAIILFEPFGDWVRNLMFVATDIAVVQFLWISFVLAIFAFLIILLTTLFYRVVDQPPQFSDRLESIGGWGFGILTGYTLAAFLLTCAHVLPVPRDYWGLFSPDADHRPGPVTALAPDYQFIWLADRVSQPLVSKKVTKRKFTPTARLLNREQLAWFPVRFAIWRERLEWFKTVARSEHQPDDEVVFVRVAERAPATSEASGEADDSATEDDGAYEEEDAYEDEDEDTYEDEEAED